MGWLGKLFGAAVSAEEMTGIRLVQPHWEIDGPKTFTELFFALREWLPDDAILYFEGGSPDTQIDQFMAEHSIPEPVHVAMGTIWPRPRVFHVPATAIVLTDLGKIMEHHAEPELAVHFHVYRNDSVLLEWHDAFSGPMLLSKGVSDDQIKIFADKLGTGFRRIEESGDATARRPQD